LGLNSSIQIANDIQIYLYDMPMPWEEGLFTGQATAVDIHDEDMTIHASPITRKSRIGQDLPARSSHPSFLTLSDYSDSSHPPTMPLSLRLGCRTWTPGQLSTQIGSFWSRKQHTEQFSPFSRFCSGFCCAFAEMMSHINQSQTISSTVFFIVCRCK
jgi:hypothetical protein